VDSHSKWPEVIPMTTTSAARTIEELRKLFATHGLPEQLVSDNGSQFTPDEFRTFTRKNGIKHIRSAPYHPATNGSAERFVQTFKQALRAALTEKKNSLLEAGELLASVQNDSACADWRGASGTPHGKKPKNEA